MVMRPAIAICSFNGGIRDHEMNTCAMDATFS
jgi:hypothetical protein